MQVNNQYVSDRVSLYNGDSCELIKNIPASSIHYSIFSPPFASLYTYSNSDRDLGNCRTHSEFYEHFQFIVQELYRVLMSGRLVSFHCMNLPTSKERDGYIGITDFRGLLIKMFQDAGFIYHSEVCIWKDPVIAMQRTKALGLLHKQIKKDSCMSRQGIADYLVTMRKPGVNEEPVWHYGNEIEAGKKNGIESITKVYKTADNIEDFDEKEELEEQLSGDVKNRIFPVDLWQKYASPIWTDINPSDTLQGRSAREEKDERHICPLQLQVIERAINLWTNPNDIVFSPFLGIGSECYQALKMGRRGVGIELKESYFNQAVANCKAIENEKEQMGLDI